jgi:HSP20 family protein
MAARRRETGLMPGRLAQDPFTLMREMTAELERRFHEPTWPSLRWPSWRTRREAVEAWYPAIDVFEKDNRLVTKIDLPGMKKDDVKVEVTDGQLVIAGERKRETEEKGTDVYRCEREYGSFYRAVPLPEGVKLDDVKATFSDGVLEVSMPVPVRSEARMQKVEIQESAKAAKSAA